MPHRERTFLSDNEQLCIRLPPALIRRARQVAIDTGSLPCHVVQEALERSLDDIRTSPTVAGRPNKAFAASN